MANKAPSISTPKGGGAQSGLGEKFSPDLFTGTGNFSVPVALPPGRNGLQPELTFGYSTGNGNSPFGLGWNISIPGVTRKASRGIPVYDDDQDVFILSGAEDLVQVKQTIDTGYVKTYYRPRTEGLYARIVHHKKPGGENYWEVRSKDGLTSYYGNPAETVNHSCVIANPGQRKSIFSWRLYKTTDAFGNHIIYRYTRELSTSGERVFDQLYLAEISYNNYVQSGVTRFLVSVRFNYEARADAFSEYRQGFEVRTTRRCDSIDIYTDSGNAKIKTYDLHYLDQQKNKPQPLNGVSLLTTITVKGFDGALTESMPPLVFNYSGFTPLNHDFYPVKGNDLPGVSLASPDIEMVDLTGNGLPDILEMNDVIRWWRNKGNGEFDRPRFMSDAPAGLQLADPDVQMIDANGDGRADLLVNKVGMSGYFATSFGGTWDQRSFQPYRYAPSFSFEDPEVKLIDLDGDGVTDVLRNGKRFECFYNHPQKGFYKTGMVDKKQLGDFPDVSFADTRIKTAEMSGDGLQDLVYIHNGTVAYWPNLGYGRFGKKITMRNSPRLPYGYDPKRILLGDVDGDGLADLIYVDNNRITLWINRSGNAWSDPVVINGTPAVHDMDSVRLTDLLGSGVSGVLWSSVYGNGGRMEMFFLDFTRGNKPYLMQEMINNMGSITRVRYESSTKFFLEDDRKPETRWKTELPFPVLVVSAVEAIDALSKGKLVTEYSYHHGYWDGAEREFRGFGRVDQRDTETFTRYNNSAHEPVVTPQGLRNFDPVTLDQYSAPTETRTWFHQGPVGDEFGGWYENDYTHEYWQGDKPLLKRSSLLSLSDQQQFDALPRRARRDALRTLRGIVLRTELYALDQSVLSARPYTVTESQSFVRKEFQPVVPVEDTFKYSSGYIFFPYQVAQRTTQWERGNDPMTSFSFSWSYDAYGQSQKQLSLGVARGIDPVTGAPFLPATGLNVPVPVSYKKYLSTTVSTEYIYKGNPLNDIQDSGLYIMNRVRESKTFDCTYTGTALGAIAFYKGIVSGTGIGYVIAHSLNYYDGTSYTGLPLGSLGIYGALTRTETLIIDGVSIDNAYRDMPPPCFGSHDWASEYPPGFDSFLQGGDPALGYKAKTLTGGPFPMTAYYAETVRNSYDFQAGISNPVGAVVGTADVFGNITSVEYLFGMLPTKITDPEGNITYAKYDIRIYQPNGITDINRNSSIFRYSPLGLLTSTFLTGKGTEGDYSPLYDSPSTRLEYDFFSFMNEGNPVWVKTTKRQYHYQQGISNATIISVEYSDGFGRLLQTRTQAEDILWGANADERIFGNSGLPADQYENDNAIGYQRNPGGPPNVVVSGWQVYNNKGKVVEKFESFFSQGFDFIPPDEMQTGQRTRMYYDPRAQLIRTVNADSSQQRVLYGVPQRLDQPDNYNPTPWETYTYDANDLAYLSPEAPDSANVPSSHYYTPKSAETDALGRTVRTMDRLEANHSTGSNVQMLYEYDIRGNLMLVTDAYGRTVFEHYYDLRPVKEDEPAVPLRTVHIDKGLSLSVFDVAAKPIELRDANKAQTLYAYDNMQRPIYMWAKDNGSEISTIRQHTIYGTSDVYNHKGKIAEQYDEAGYLVMEAYDFKGNPLSKYRQVFDDVYLINSMGASGVCNYEAVNWDGLDHGMLDPKIYQSTLEYDALNRMIRLIYPEDVNGLRKELVPEYNHAGALRKVTLEGQEFVKEIAYNAKGQRILIAYGNNLMTRYAYDETTFRLKRLRTERYTYLELLPEHWFSYEPGTTRQDFYYVYDLCGNIREIHDKAPQCGEYGNDEINRYFDYDALYRLIYANGRDNQPDIDFPRWDDTFRSDDPYQSSFYEQGYTYDLMGNMQVLNHNGNNSFYREFDYHHGDNNRLRSMYVGGNDYYYEYDECGNVIMENDSRWFGWDYAGRMRNFKVESGGKATVCARYMYDGGGNRVKKLVKKQGGSKEVSVFIDGMFEHRYALDGSNTVIEQQDIVHIMDDITRVASFRTGDSMGDPTPDIQYILNDHLGSSNMLVDENGTMVSREEYYPFGETSFGSYGKKRYRFCGKEKDEESGLYYYGARYYSPWLCRFVSVDPLAGKYPFYTPYQYAGNKPINKTDRDGLEETGDSPQTPVATGQGGGDAPIKEVTLKEVVIVGVRNSILGSINSDPSANFAPRDATNVTLSPNTFTAPATELEKINNYWKAKVGSETYALMLSQAHQCQATVQDANPNGYNEEYLATQKRIANVKYQLAQYKKLSQDLHPYLNGGGDMGMGVSKGVVEGGKIMAGDAALKYTLVGGVKVLSLLNKTKVAPTLWPAASGGRTVINGIEYTTHALERMQPVGTIMEGSTSFSRGISPSVIENAIRYGKVTPGNTASEVVRTFENVRVVTDPLGMRVITVFKLGY
jgi:RHS repeat-associated protein